MSGYSPVPVPAGASAGVRFLKMMDLGRQTLARMTGKVYQRPFHYPKSWC